MSLESDIKSFVESVNLELYDISTVNENDETIYRVSVMSKEMDGTKRSGVSLDTCVELTHLISPLLDVTAPVSGDYRLEVGSAGIERKITSLEQFTKSIGENVLMSASGKDKIKGVLSDVKDSKIFVQTKEELLEFQYNEIKKARTYFEW